MNVELTDTAANHISKLCAAEGKKYFRLRVNSGGCSGFSYVFSVEDSANETDSRIEKQDAIMLVDNVSLPFVAGSRLDYIESLSGSYFKVINPNASSGCGCGTSFAV
jgi:iron-sulfur cluster insertion protein